MFARKQLPMRRGPHYVVRLSPGDGSAYHCRVPVAARQTLTRTQLQSLARAVAVAEGEKGARNWRLVDAERRAR